MRNPDMVYVLKMEYVSKINIFGLKSEKWFRKNIFEIPPCAKPFSDLLIYLIKGGFLPKITKFSNKNVHVCAWRDFNCTSCVLYLDILKDQLEQTNHPYSIC